MAISITQFASDSNLLNTPLWDKQSEILEEFWAGNYAIAVWALGRRSGKTLMSAIVATYCATMLADEYKRHLRPGEKFYIISVANTIDQAKIALQGVKDLINGSPILKPLIVRETTDTLELRNGAVFRALTASSRSGRGMACPLLIFDELAHAVDTEAGNAAGSSLYQALSPSVAQFGKIGKILLLSSPWIQSGIFWDLYKQAASGNFAHMQVVQAPTWEVNTTISAEFLEQEKARDPELFKVEYGAQFTGNIAAFIDNQLVDAAINSDRGLLPPLNKFNGTYYLALDPAKGGRDAYTACIVHYDGELVVVDQFHQFAPTWGDGKKTQVAVSLVEDWILEQHKAYGFASVVLDQYNSSSTIQRLSGRVKIRELTWTASSKTEAYSKLRELFNGGSIELYPHPKANGQIKNLTVTYRPNGTWGVSGGTGAAVDDYPSALAGAVLMATNRINKQQIIPAKSYRTW
ncbi:phage terminase-like protein, large subunit [Synechocystis sp. PCC 7509]|uniref:phage terminase-like protein, large subunit n=1 Tax=Synechocystis sp. PCC 7509 TaxID=927677 RepID=UPI0002AC8D74|nr:phage terminase-like protein, large subunit [Synechocystis sp. PCC 7509]